MDCCYEPGEVVILPKYGGANYLREQWGESYPELNIIYSVEDLLHRYEILNKSDNLPQRFPFVTRVPEGEEDEQALRFRDHPEVEVAVPNYFVRPSGLNSRESINDSFIKEALHKIGCDIASPICGKDVKIAIIDTGVDADILLHPNSLHRNQYFTDTPNTKFIASPEDNYKHGCYVAYIINSIAPSAQIYSFKMMDKSGNLGGLLTALYLAEAVCQPDIYNMSLALSCGRKYCPHCRSQDQVNEAQLQKLFELIDRPTQQKPLLVASAGNGTSTVMIPAIFPNVLAVGSLESTKTYTNLDPSRFILAPGGNDSDTNCVASLINNDSWNSPKRHFGTSFSAAFVSGIAARYLCSSCKSGGGSTNISTRDFLMDCLTSAARKDYYFDPTKHGMGTAFYDRMAMLNAF